MKKFIYSFIKKLIEKYYDIWGTRIEADLPPEFIITDHATHALRKRFRCKKIKFHKIMVKAWNSKSSPDLNYIKTARRKHPRGIYKIFNGYIFVFRLRYNKKLGCSQKYLVTVYKKKGYQLNY
jgi:hypothetical protein